MKKIYLLILTLLTYGFVFSQGNFRLGNRAPNNSTPGNLNDVYLNTSTNDLYIKKSATLGWLKTTNLGGKDWSLKGNSGTSLASDFIGTKDNVSLQFRINNEKAGLIERGDEHVTTFGENTFLGFHAGALYVPHPEDNIPPANTAIGANALSRNVIGRSNTAVGAFALNMNDMDATGNGSFNTAVGHGALAFNSTGKNNTAVGFSAINSNTIGVDNSAFGGEALSANTSGGFNSAVGFRSLKLNTSGTHNTAIGGWALAANTIGNFNTADGRDALVANINGSQNTAAGFQALSANVSGIRNTAVGMNALLKNTTGSMNTAIGDSADLTSNNFSNATAIGYLAIVDDNNKVRIGNTSVSSIGGQVGWTNYSDERIKTNVQYNVPGLEFINLLKPATYYYDIAKENELLGHPNQDIQNVQDIEKISFSGFMAQDVEKAATNIGYNFSGVDKSGNIWGLRYSEFVVPLVKAVQEQQVIIENLIKENEELRTTKANVSELISMKEQVNQLKSMIQNNSVNSTSNISSK